MAHILAIDIGGTFLKSATVELASDGTFQLGAVHRAPTQLGSENGAELLAQIVEIGRRAISETGISAVGVVTPGLLDEAAGVIKYATNLAVRDFAIRDQLEAALAVPVALGHDGRAAALAEHVLGAGSDFANFALMPIGTGISVGLVIDGEVRLSDGLIGEIGHANTGTGIICGCGLVGCFETAASTSGIAARYQALTGRSADAAEVVRLAANGDESAEVVWSQALDHIAIACDWLMNTIAPEAVVFAGGLSKAGEALLDPLRQRIAARVSFQRLPELRIAALGDDAGTLGAALLAKRAVGL